MKRVETGKLEQITFDGFADEPMLVYKWPPPGGKATHMNSVVQTAIGAVDKLSSETYAARRDAGLSPSGRAANLQPARDAAKASLERAQTLFLSQERQRIGNAWTKLYAIPGLEPGDAAGAALDAEIRQRMNGLSEAESANLVGAINKGDKAHDRVLYALARDPFDTPHAQWARGVHTERVTTELPVEVAAIESAQDELEWAGSAVDRLQTILKETDSRNIAALRPETV